MVSDYTRLNFNEIKLLYYDEYLLYLRDAFIDNLSKTEEGREYLLNAYRITQTEPQREKIREKIKERSL